MSRSTTRRRSPFDTWTLPVLFGIVSALFAAASVAVAGHARVPTDVVTIEVRGEDGTAVRNSVFVAAGDTIPADGAGRIRVSGVRELVAGVVQAPRYLSEPLVLDPESRHVRMSLWERRGGRRFSYNAAGDVMLGRRYLASRDGAEPLLSRDRLGRGAQEIVEAVAPLFAAATVSSINLETVVAPTSRKGRYPGKRFVIVSPPGVLPALRDLGVDVALGANNHVRDLLDEGVEQTRAAVESEEILYAGAGMTRAQAAVPARLRAGTATIDILAFSTVDGTPVNDAYIGASERRSPGWLRERRVWGYRERGGVVVASRPRRIGQAWRVFRAVEARDPRRAARMWPSLSSTYAELQDWNAGRGHGGANPWDDVTSPAAIRRAAVGDGLVVVQFQSGFQYLPWKAANIKRLSRNAIDAGADIVIAHHPHVLQGFEWYRGRLIAYSLGNFVFDQDLLATFPGGFLHTVWEGHTLLEARLIPTMLNEYRPRLAAGITARRLLREVAGRSASPVTVERGRGGLRYVAASGEPNGLPSLSIDRSTLVIRPPGLRKMRSRTISLAPGQVMPLDAGSLYRVKAARTDSSVMVGVNGFPYGTFDDVWSGGRGALFWQLGAGSRLTDGGRMGGRALEMRLLPGRTTLVRPTGRIPLFDPAVATAGGDRAWQRGAFEFRFWVKTEGAESLSVRLDFYRLDDSNPTVDPVSQTLTSRAFDVPSRDGAHWREVRLSFRLPDRATHVLPYILGTAARPERVAIDDVELVLWRAVGGPVVPFVPADYLESRGQAPASSTVEELPLVVVPRSS